MATDFQNFVQNNIRKASDHPVFGNYVSMAKDIINATALKVSEQMDGDAKFKLASKCQLAVTSMEDVFTAAYMMIYGLPVNPIQSDPTVWVNVPDHPKIGSEVMVGPDLSITVTKVERHIETVADSLVEILRFNGDDRLAAMTYGCIIEDFEKIGEKQPSRSFAVNCFIQQFPFTVPMPLTLEAYRMNNIGVLSDVTHRFAVICDDLMQQAYSPAGTRLFPISLPENTHPFSQMVGAAQAPAAQETPTADGTGEPSLHIMPKE